MENIEEHRKTTCTTVSEWKQRLNTRVSGQFLNKFQL